jgi:hypothetical protein
MIAPYFHNKERDQKAALVEAESPAKNSQRRRAASSRSRRKSANGKLWEKLSRVCAETLPTN